MPGSGTSVVFRSGCLNTRYITHILYLQCNGMVDFHAEIICAQKYEDQDCKIQGKED